MCFSSPIESRRRSVREQPMESGRRSAGRREGQTSTHRRFRSRSAGRQRQSGVPSPYYVGPEFSPHQHHGSSHASPTNFYESSDHGERRRSGRLSRNNTQQQQHGYYSSDGSGQLSPPPKLPNKSGVPPTKPNVLLHRPAPK